jgi:hypothetical protein
MAELSLSDFLAIKCKFKEKDVEDIAAKLKKEGIDEVS